MADFTQTASARQFWVAHASRVPGEGLWRSRTSLISLNLRRAMSSKGKFVSARRRNQHARRVRYLFADVRSPCSRMSYQLSVRIECAARVWVASPFSLSLEETDASALVWVKDEGEGE